MLDSRTLRSRWSTLCAGTIAVVTLAVMVWRMFYGVDVSDESFYVAIPGRFAMGDKPFVDDLSIAQTAGLLFYPFVKAYLSIAGTTGLFLYVRILYLVFFACVGWSLYALARPRLPKAAAILLATACICYMPYSAPGLSYNTIALGLLSIGFFTTARWLLDEVARQPFWRAPIYWAGLAHGAACFAYPSLILSIFATAAAVVVVATGRRVRALGMYAGGGLSFALLTVPLLISAGRTQLGAMSNYTMGDSPAGGFTLTIISERLAMFRAHHPELLVAVAAAVLAALAVRRWPRPIALVAMLLPLLSQGSTLTGYMGSLGYIASFALLGPILALGLRDRRPAVVLVLVVSIPSLVAGMAWSLSSGNGILAFGVGAYPAALITGLILALFIDGAVEPTSWARFRPALALAPAVLVAVLVRYATADNAHYADGPRSQMSKRIWQGPFWGLYTTPTKDQFIAELTADLHKYRGGPDTRLYCNIPASYIIAERRPLVAAVWIFPAPMRIPIDAEFLLSRAQPGDLIIQGQEPNWLIKQMIAATSELVVQREQYAVLVYRGYGQIAASMPPVALAFDEWRELSDPATDALVPYGWSWAESWGRWSVSHRSGLTLLRPEGASGATTVKLDMLANTSRAVRKQHYKIRVGGTVVAEGSVSGDGGVVELTVPSSLTPQRGVHLSFELPDAWLSSGRLLGIGLRRVMISRKADG